MALKFSSGLRCSLLGNASRKGTDLAFGDNGASPDTITSASNALLTAGFKVADAITVAGATTGGNNISAIALTVVTAGTLTFATGNLAATEAGIAATTVTGNNGGAFKNLFTDGIIHIYSGSQPADADTTESGTLLLKITESSLAFTGGSATNGLEFRAVTSGVLSKNATVWSGVGLVTATAGWFRFYDNLNTTGASTTAVRFDGSVGTSGSELVLSSTSIAVSATTTVDTFTMTQPAS